MKRISIWPIVALVFLSVPLLLFAFPQPPTGNTGAPGDGNCMGCHSGSSTGGSTSVTFPSGLSYTPGVTQHLTVTVNDTTHNVWSFQLTARLASNTSTQAGSFTATDTVNTIVQGQDIETTNSGIGQSKWNIDWTPPATNVGNVNLYLTGMGAGSPGGATSGNGIYNASYVLTPAAAPTPDFSLSASPSSLTITQGSSGSSTITVTPQNGFSGTVAFSTSTLPSGVTPSFGTGGLLTLTASSTAATGTSTVTITGTSGSLSHTTSLSLTVNAVVVSPTLTAAPSSLSFRYQTGGTTPPTQNITVTTSGGFTYTVGTTGGAWLSATPASGTTSGPITVSVNPAGLAAGPYAGMVTITASSGSPQATVNVSLTVTAAPSAGLTSTPSSLSFSYQIGGRVPTSKTLAIAGTSGSTTFTATESDPWLSISPATGSIPGSIRVSVNPTGLAAGSHNAQIHVSAANGQTVTVPVTLAVTSSSGCGDDDCGGGGGTPSGMYAQAYVHDPTQSGALVAAWVDNLGTSPHNTLDPLNRALVLSKGVSAPTDGYAGAVIQNAVGISLTELGLDYRGGIQCGGESPYFRIVTTDGVTHTLGGCASGSGTAQSVTTTGWIHLRFDLTKAMPTPIQPTDHVQSITIVLDKAPNQTGAAGSIAVIDNIDVNGVILPKR